VNLQNYLGHPLVPHKRYCAHIQPLPNFSGGFVASTKLEQVLAQFAKIPKGEKVSFIVCLLINCPPTSSLTSLFASLRFWFLAFSKECWIYWREFSLKNWESIALATTAT
jgi:hypothetical protein